MIFYNIWRAISLANLNQGVCKEPGMTLVANFYLDNDCFLGVLCERQQKSRHVDMIKHSVLMSRRHVHPTVASVHDINHNALVCVNIKMS